MVTQCSFLQQEIVVHGVLLALELQYGILHRVKMNMEVVPGSFQGTPLDINYNPNLL